MINISQAGTRYSIGERLTDGDDNIADRTRAMRKAAESLAFNRPRLENNIEVAGVPGNNKLFGTPGSSASSKLYPRTAAQIPLSQYNQFRTVRW